MLRRSELVALEVSDIEFDADGSGTVTVRFSKTDQAAEGHVRYLAPFAGGRADGLAGGSGYCGGVFVSAGET
jgi:hypothetical protein